MHWFTNGVSLTVGDMLVELVINNGVIGPVGDTTDELVINNGVIGPDGDMLDELVINNGVTMKVIDDGLQHLLDAYVVVFAINDHDSFDQAQQLVRYLRVDHGTDRVILLVANKIDLVRKRKVTADEARLVSETYDCKYAETSAALNHHLDELLVGILTQIRLHMRIPFTTISFPGKESKNRDRKEKKKAFRGPRGFFSRLFRRAGRKKPKPCENLYAL
ncbi:hypothetical protein Btru_013538 [Bulinus truncatus]|nr:hypothetical protein Btru_013538 [Bulinus truncatus]